MMKEDILSRSSSQEDIIDLKVKMNQYLQETQNE